MKRSTQRKIEQIAQYPFFQKVGTPLSESVTAIHDWKIALHEFTSIKWENCRLMARNVLQERVETINWDRSEEWNPLVREIKPSVNDCASDILKRIPAPKKLADNIMGHLAWDFLFICLEEEYKDLVLPVFYVPYLEIWYASGHFPCGWDGEEFPYNWDGTLEQGRVKVF